METTFQTLAIASVSTILGSLTLGAVPVHAAQLSVDFSVEIISGDLLVGETFSGRLVYEDALLTGIGTELIDPASGLLSLDFTYVGSDLITPVTYTEADDDLSAGFPLATFQEGEPAGLDFSVSITPDLVFQFREEPLGSDDFALFTDNLATFETNVGVIAFAEPTAVPEPTVLLGFVGMAILLGQQHRR